MHVLALLALLPFMGSLTAALTRSRLYSWLASTVFSCAALMAYLAALALHPPELVILGSPENPLLSFSIDGFGAILAGVALAVGVLIMLFSYDYMSPRNKEHPVEEGFSRYYSLMMLFMGSMVCVALSNTFLALLVFYELTGICSCMLIAFYGGREDVSAGMRAFILTHVGAFSLLVAVVLLYASTGRVDFGSVALLKPSTLALVGALFLVAGWAKSAQLPFHLWLPGAMVAPTTVSAYLHAAAMVKVGVFTYLRFLQGALPMLARGCPALTLLGYVTLAGSLITMYYAAFSYYRQRDLKGLLAYSTIVQLSVMFCALSFVFFQRSPLGLYAAAYHMWNHAYAKALLFLTVGALAYATGRRDLDALSGLSKSQPTKLLAASWLVGAAAISTIPPLNCFFSKLAILFTGFKGPELVLLAAVLALAEGYLLTLPIFMRLGFKAVTGREAPAVASEPTLLMKLVLVVLAVMTVVSAFVVPASMPSWW